MPGTVSDSAVNRAAKATVGSNPTTSVLFRMRVFLVILVVMFCVSCVSSSKRKYTDEETLEILLSVKDPPKGFLK